MPEAGTAPRRLGLIGCGRIGAPVVAAWRSGGLPGWEITGVLTRKAPDMRLPCNTQSGDAFFARDFDLIVEAGGPAALAEHGSRALSVADVWSVSAAALADSALYAELQRAGTAAGHRLRLLPGAIAGLDGIGMACVDPAATLQLDIDLLPGSEPPGQVFTGTVREAAAHFPNHVNVAAAAALAGPGLDATRIAVHRPGPVQQHRLALSAHSAYGDVQASLCPHVAPGIHPVAASVIWALRRELQTIWAG